MRKNRAYFIAGFTPRQGLLGVAAYLHELEDQEVEFTRFYMTRNGQWANREFSEDIVSVSYTREADDWSWWLLSKRGKVIRSSPKGRFMEVVPEAGTGRGSFGYLNEIRVIDGSLYAVGLGRQVYKRADGEWLRIDGGIRIDATDVGFQAIDGASDDNIHAVGYAGEIWYFDGERWRSVVSPTNVTLEAVRVVAPTLCYACGKSGVVLRGFRDSWELLNTGVSDNFWAVEYFKNRVYFATTKGLFALEGDLVRPLDLGRRVEGRRLYSNGDELWSVEHHELWVFDGSKWQEVICPDNDIVS